MVLRRFLGDLDELPDRPLVAFIPVNVRPPDSEGGGNYVGATLVSLATDIEEPASRLAAIASSSRVKANEKMVTTAAAKNVVVETIS